MPKKLEYGGSELRLRDDEDLMLLRERVNDALNSGSQPWCEVVGAGGDVHWILVTPGVPVRVAYEAPAPAPVQVGM